MAHTWASTESVGAVLPRQVGYWASFENLSGWTQTRPEDILFYEISGDNDWWVLQNALMVEEFSKYNPSEDFASVWKLYFDPNGSSTERQRLVSKITKVDDLFTMLEKF